MATQDEQMNMLMQQGGMQNDGMTRDPVSGNEVPPGSLAKEVRDDIPAQLSEGEYVIPADAVQFHGLKFYEATVQEAKMGLADMNARGRIGGEPIPQEQTPQALPFDISELQTDAPTPPMMPQQANRGGLIRSFDNGGFTGVSNNPQLDYSNTDEYFGSGQSSGQGASLARYIASGCKQIEVLVSGNRVPISANSTTVDDVNYVDITSDAGLNILKGCSELSLNPDEEKVVIDRIGQDEYDKWKDGESRPTDSGETEDEPEPPRDDDDDKRGPAPDDFIKGWGMDKMTDYYGDMSQYYDGTEDTLIGGILKGITKPIVKLNHKHIVGRSMVILEGGVDPKTGKDLSQAQIDTLNGILKMNPDGMIQGTFKIGGRTITWNPETGTYESDSFNPTIISDGGGGGEPYVKPISDQLKYESKSDQTAGTILNPGAMTRYTTGAMADRYGKDKAKSGASGFTDITATTPKTSGLEADSSGKISLQGSASRQSDNEDRRQAKAQQKEVINRTKDLVTDQAAIDRKKAESDASDDPFEASTGQKRATGGLITRPKRKRTTKKK